MKNILKVEELAMAAIAIYFLSRYDLGLPLWLWVILFFAPDIGALGYLVNTRIGAFTYNILHHKGIAIAVAAIGLFMHNEITISIGILLFAHSSFDRIWGYGLKFPGSFKSTHLGTLQGSK